MERPNLKAKQRQRDLERRTAERTSKLWVGKSRMSNGMKETVLKAGGIGTKRLKEPPGEVGILFALEMDEVDFGKDESSGSPDGAAWASSLKQVLGSDACSVTFCRYHVHSALSSCHWSTLQWKSGPFWSGGS